MYRTLPRILFILILSLLNIGWVASANPPSVLDVSPASVPNDLSTTITITGADFQPGAAVSLNGPGVTGPLAAVYISAAELTVRVPWGLPAGNYSLTVENPDGLSTQWTGTFVVENSMDRWRTGGPYGGRPDILIVDPTNTQVVYAALSNAGVFRSLDGGGLWQQILRMPSYAAMALDVTQTPPALFAIRDNATLLRTADRGETWTQIPIDYKGFDFYGASLFTGPDGTLYAGLRSALVKTSDLGAHWIGVMDVSENEGSVTEIFFTALGFDPHNTQIMYLGRSDKKVFRSADGGATWQALGEVSSVPNQIVVDPVDGKPWAATSGGYQHGNGPLQYYASGQWNAVIIQAGNDNANQPVWLAFDPHTPGTLYAGSGWRSTNHGQTWSPLTPYDSTGGPVAVDPGNSNILYLGNGGSGIIKTTDLASDQPDWTVINNGLAGIVPYQLAIDPLDPANLYANTGSGLYHSVDGGEHWQAVPMEYYMGGSLLIDHFGSTVRVFTGKSGSLGYSDDAGENWNQVIILDPPGQITDQGSFKSLVRSQASGVERLVGAYSIKASDHSAPYTGAIMVSGDHGRTWSPVSSTVGAGPFQTVTAALTNPAVLYAIEGQVNGAGGRAWKSTDGGQTWAHAGLDGKELFDIAVDPYDSQVVYAAVRSLDGEHLISSLDGGQTWTRRSQFNNYGLMNLYAIPESRTMLYCTGWNGMTTSQDGGATFTRPVNPFANSNIGGMAYLQQPDGLLTIYIATSGGIASQASETPALQNVAGTILSAGVYRRTVQYRHIYLPVVWR